MPMSVSEDLPVTCKFCGQNPGTPPCSHDMGAQNELTMCATCGGSASSPYCRHHFESLPVSTLLPPPFCGHLSAATGFHLTEIEVDTSARSSHPLDSSLVYASAEAKHHASQSHQYYSKYTAQITSKAVFANWKMPSSPVTIDQPPPLPPPTHHHPPNALGSTVLSVVSDPPTLHEVKGLDMQHLAKQIRDDIPEMVGRGGMGTVYRCKTQPNNQNDIGNPPEVAVKVVGQGGDDRNFKNEILCDIAEGMEYLHCQEPPVVHCDLKPSNVLLSTSTTVNTDTTAAAPAAAAAATSATIGSSNFRAHVADFGLCRQLPSGRTHLSTNPGRTKDFAPPEQLTKRPIIAKPLDVYAFGATILAVVAERNNPGALIDHDSMEHLVALTPFPEIRPPHRSIRPEVCRRLYSLAARRCLLWDPKARASFSEIRLELADIQEDSKTPLMSGCRDDMGGLQGILLPNAPYDLEKLQLKELEDNWDAYEESSTLKREFPEYFEQIKNQEFFRIFFTQLSHLINNETISVEVASRMKFEGLLALIDQHLSLTLYKFHAEMVAAGAEKKLRGWKRRVEQQLAPDDPLYQKKLLVDEQRALLMNEQHQKYYSSRSVAPDVAHTINHYKTTSTLDTKLFPTLRPLADLDEVSLQSLKLGVNSGKCIRATSIVDGTLLSGFTTIIQDQSRCHTLSMYNCLPSGGDQSLANWRYGEGTIFAVKEPYLKVSSNWNGQVVIRVDYFTDVEVLQDVELDSARAGKERGNQLFQRGFIQAAVRVYTKTLSLTDCKDDMCATLLSNRAQCNLTLKDYREAFRDCAEALDLSKLPVTLKPKTMHRKAQALAGLHRFSEALDLLDKISQEFLLAEGEQTLQSLKPASSELNRMAELQRAVAKQKTLIERQRDQATTGRYDWERLVRLHPNFVGSMTEMDVEYSRECAEYLSPKLACREVKRRHRVGRGMVATCRIKAASLLAVCVPFESQTVDASRTMGVEFAQSQAGPRVTAGVVLNHGACHPELRAKVIQGVLESPWRRSALYALDDGSPLPCRKVRIPDIRNGAVMGLYSNYRDPELQGVDVQRIEKIVSRHCFSYNPCDAKRLKEKEHKQRVVVSSDTPDRNEAKTSDDGKEPEISALYILGSLFNPSFHPNAVSWFAGGLLVIRSHREIKSGEEVTISYTPGPLYPFMAVCLQF
eukprot:gene6132-1095_t